MTRWAPGPDWFAAETPDLARIARDAAALPALAPVLARNFP
jgi:GST-like protein